MDIAKQGEDGKVDREKCSGCRQGYKDRGIREMRSQWDVHRWIETKRHGNTGAIIHYSEMLVRIVMTECRECRDITGKGQEGRDRQQAGRRL